MVSMCFRGRPNGRAKRRDEQCSVPHLLFEQSTFCCEVTRGLALLAIAVDLDCIAKSILFIYLFIYLFFSLTIKQVFYYNLRPGFLKVSSFYSCPCF